MQEVYRTELNQIKQAQTSEVNLLASIENENIGIGVRANKVRRILLLGYDSEKRFDEQKKRAHGLVDTLLEDLNNPQIILAGFVPPKGGNEMLGYLLDYLNGHKVDMDDRTYLGGFDAISKKRALAPIGKKDLVLGPLNARVIPYNRDGKFNIDDVRNIVYLKI